MPDIFDRVQSHEEMSQFMISIILYAYGKKERRQKAVFVGVNHGELPEPLGGLCPCSLNE